MAGIHPLDDDSPRPPITPTTRSPATPRRWLLRGPATVQMPAISIPVTGLTRPRRPSRPPVQVVLQVPEPIAPPADVQHVARVQQPVQDRRRDHLVARQHLRPVLDRLV